MNTINLLPEDYLQRRRQHRGNLICAVLFGIVIVSICGAAVVSERSTQRTREVCDRMNTAYAQAAKLIDEVHQLEAQKGRMLDKAKRSAALMERMPRSYLLAMLSNALPDGASLKSVRMAMRTVAAPASAQPKTKAAAVKAKAKPRAPKVAVVLSINGRATTDVQVARFIARLAAHPLTDVVDLAYSKESDGQQKTATREFQLTVMLKPDADVLDAIRDQSPKANSENTPARLTMGDAI